VTTPSKAWTSIDIGFLTLPRKLCSGKQAFSITLNAGTALRVEPVPNHCGRALAASEAGRTARADAAKDFGDLARPCVGFAAWDVQASESRLLKPS